jgi:hypothetical protein
MLLIPVAMATFSLLILERAFLSNLSIGDKSSEWITCV